MLAIVEVPEGISEPGVREVLLQRHSIEIMTAFGPLRGRAWRIGVMAHNAEVKTVLHFLAAFEEVLADAGLRVAAGAGVEAASRTTGV